MFVSYVVNHQTYKYEYGNDSKLNRSGDFISNEIGIYEEIQVCSF